MGGVKKLAYQLDFLAAMKAIFVPVDPLFHFIIFIIFAVVISGPLYLVYQLKKRVSLQTWLLFIGMAVIPVAGLLGVSLLHTGSGWQLENGRLQIKTAVWAKETIELEKARVALVESTGPWQAEWRTGGLGLPGLAAGRFVFQNGETALYFRHLGSPRRVVLAVDNRYYVLVHPGVEELYEELIARGAQPAEL